MLDQTSGGGCGSAFDQTSNRGCDSAFDQTIDGGCGSAFDQTSDGECGSAFDQTIDGGMWQCVRSDQFCFLLGRYDRSKNASELPEKFTERA